MLLEPRNADTPIGQSELVKFEEDCAGFYARHGREEVWSEVRALTEHIVAMRRELHQALVDRQVERASAAMARLLRLEAQAAAARRAHGEAPPAAPLSSPGDRRVERRRTAR